MSGSENRRMSWEAVSISCRFDHPAVRRADPLRRWERREFTQVARILPIGLRTPGFALNEHDARRLQSALGCASEELAITTKRNNAFKC
jgi:hypothetical protein